MGVKEELHRLVDSLPARETQAAKRFIEFLLTRSRAQDAPEERPFYTLEEAALALRLTPRKLRQLIRDGVVPGHKAKGRWTIDRKALSPWMNPVGLALLHAPVMREPLSENDLHAIDAARRDYASGNTKSLDEIKRRYNVRQ